jgi:hypothetical protein
VHPSLAFQEAKREQCRQELERELARMLLILKAQGVLQVILFGSAARGKLHMASDLEKSLRWINITSPPTIQTGCPAACPMKLIGSKTASALSGWLDTCSTSCKSGYPQMT